MKGTFTGAFSDKESVASNFAVHLGEGVEIVYADYDCPPYEGYANVIFVENGKLYQVYGSHCSCYGLEGQWEPDEINLPYLKQSRFPVDAEDMAELEKRFGS